MILHVIRCEVCQKEHPFHPDSLRGSIPVPANWITFVEGSPQDNEALHACSKQCLASWALSKLAMSPDAAEAKWAASLFNSGRTPIEAPASKMRRFMLVDGETADEVEGIKWGNDCVSLDPEQAIGGLWFYASWEEFKQSHPGSGITWIDQEEVSDAAN